MLLMTVTVRPSKELVEYIKSRMLGCIIAHMIVKHDLDVDKLLNSLVKYFYKAYSLRYSLDKEVFEQIANSIKQNLSNY
jgi:hypothetical protein